MAVTGAEIMSVISNGEELTRLAGEWDGVMRMRDRLQKHGGGAPGGHGAVTATEVIYNLPLLLAFDVLRGALRAIKKEGRFSSEGNGLRSLMKAAQDAIPWIDYKALRKGAKRRNAVARDGELFPAAVCLRDIENVAAQLRAWGIGQS
jgi:hypothetical protein